MPRTLIKNTLSTLLNNLTPLFDHNELAYLSIQGKNELQIRDKVAWNLQIALDNQFRQGVYLVCHEWGPKQGRSKVDMAVLDGKNGHPIALFEFKAHYLLNDETYMYAEFVKDTNKMYGLCMNNEDIDMYFIFIQNVSSPNRPVGGILQYIIPASYAGRLNNTRHSFIYTGSTTGVVQNQIQTIWDGFYNYNHNNFPNPYSPQNNLAGLHFFAPQPNSIPQFNINQLQYVDSIYGCPCYIAPLIWGPYTWNNLDSHKAYKF